MPTSRHAILLGLTVLLAFEARAALVALPAPLQELGEVVQLADGRLAVSGSKDQQGFVYLIDPAGRDKNIEIPVATGTGRVVRYRDGFASWGRSATTHEVRYYETGRVVRESVLHSSEGLDYLHLVAAPAGDSLYVAESRRRGGMRLIRFDGSGRLAWSRNFPDGPNGVTAVNDGVVFMQALPAQAGQVRTVLTKLGLDGELAWSSPAAFGTGGAPMVRFHSRTAIAVASATPDESIEIVNYDNGSGEQVSHFAFPGYPQLVGTAEGLLVSHSYVYRPYIAMMDAAGSVRWWRRYTPTQPVGVPVSAATTHEGRLILLTRNGNAEDWPDNKVVLMSANARELGEGLNVCTKRDPIPVMQAEILLRARYGVEVRPDYSLMPVARNRGCAHPTDDEYAAAVAAIAEQFVDREKVRNPWHERVYAMIMGSGPAMQLSHYFLGMGAADAPQRSIAFHVRHDNAKAFAHYLRATVFPHMDRIEEARTRFTEMTGQVYGAHLPYNELPDADEFFARMERATQVLEQKVRVAGRADPWPRRLMVGALLYPTQFGSYGQMQPLDVADQTLRELIRKAAEKQHR